MTAEIPEKIPSSKRLLLLVVCGLLLIGLWLAQVHPYLNVANDAGRYMTLGKSLAATGELRLINDPRQPLDTLYPPAFPAVIAFWLRVTGRAPGDVVLLVKITQLLFLLAVLPLLLRLLEAARLPFRYCVGALLIAACSPVFASYANEVLSEAPFMLLCLASVTLVERDLRSVMKKEETEEGSAEATAVWWQRILALACAVGAFLIRTAGIALLLSQCVWFWRRFGWKWGLAALLVTLTAAGGWQMRNRRIVKNAPPGVHYSTYIDQFTLRDPMRPGAGRIQPNLKGLLLRAYEGFPPYLGMIPRSILHSMSRHSPVWFPVFYLLAVPMGVLILFGCGVAWRRGLQLSAGFPAFFWLFAAMWPWRDPRFLVPLMPFFLLFLFLSLDTAEKWLAPRIGVKAVHGVLLAFAALLLAYFAQVHGNVIRAERRPLASGYAFGRTPEEGGFFAAADWLRKNTPPDSIVMGRPAYLLYLYSDRVTTQIEPHPNPRVQELAYMKPNRVRYIVEDTWTWASTAKYIDPYIRDYGSNWRLAWEDRGSGVRIWERIVPYAEEEGSREPKDK